MKMITHRHSVILVMVGLSNIARASLTTDAFIKHEIIPDVLASGAPEKTLSVKYNSGVEASLGNVLTPTQVKDQPEVKWEAEQGALYTLILTDPDATSRKNPIYREFEHWLIVNIPGTDISKGDSLAAYIGSGPPKDTGLHRYVFLLYNQPKGRIEDAEHGIKTNTSRQGRPGFKAAKFAEKHGLGAPIYGNLYQAEYDDYVPILHSQMG